LLIPRSPCLIDRFERTVEMVTRVNFKSKRNSSLRYSPEVPYINRMSLYTICGLELRIAWILCTGRRLNGERLAERESNDLHSAAIHRVSGQLVAD